MTFNTSSNDWPVIKSGYQTHWKLKLIKHGDQSDPELERIMKGRFLVNWAIKT